MSKVVNVDFVTKVVEIQVSDTQEQSLATQAAVNSAATAEACVERAETILDAVKNGYGYPLTAATADAMTDHDKIYVYVGSEAGYTNGNWYYYDGTEFVSGGIYNSTAFNADKTLTIENAAADAKITGITSGVFPGTYSQFVGGAINAGTGEDTTASTRARTLGYLPVNIIGIDHVGTGYQYELLAYQQDGTYVGIWNGSGFETTASFRTDSKLYFKDISANNYKYRISFMKTSNTSISASDAVNNLYFMYSADNLLANGGRAADALTVGNVLSANVKQINVLHNLINYGYSATEEILEKSASDSTDSSNFELRRCGQVVRIKGSLASSVYFKLSGNMRRTINASTVRGWNGELSLVEGHHYKLKLYCLSDDAKANFNYLWAGAYVEGTASSIGARISDEEKKTKLTLFTAPSTALNVVLYVSPYSELTDAVIMITLEDLTYSVNEGLEYADERINIAHNYINYGYGIYEEVFSNTHHTVARYGTFVTVSGSYAYAGRMALTGLKMAYTTSDVAAWSDGIQLVEGSSYRLTATCVSQNAIENIISATVYKNGEGTSIGDHEFVGNKSIRTFVAPAEKVNLCLYLYPNITFADEKIEVTLELLQANTDDYYADELTDTIAKVQNIKDEPCLTFMWTTDIHKDSSNALGVQTFDKMVQNMKSFSKAVRCDFILNTGDDTDGNVAQATTLTRAYDMAKTFQSIGVPYIKAHGNHDNNPYIQSGAAVFNLKQCFKAYFTLTPHYVTYNIAENGTDFYLDYNDIGVRLISVNANNCETSVTYSWGSTTPTWLANALDTDRTVILVMHISPIATQVYNNTPVKTSALNNEVLSALNTFVNNGGNLIMLSGHSHADMAFISPWLSVMEICQRYYEDESSVDDDEGFQKISGYIDVIKRPIKTPGTYTEDAWTAGVYKPFSNELHLIRFGAGTDRHFHITPIAPTTVTTILTGTITWGSSDENVATVSDGVITGVSTGKCAVLAKDASGNYECWIVSVE